MDEDGEAAGGLQRGYKFRLYPKPIQEELLLEWQETHRRVWNVLLAPYVQIIKTTVTPKKSWDVCETEARAAGASGAALESAALEVLRADGLRFKKEVHACFKAQGWTLKVMREKDRATLRELRRTNPFCGKISYGILDDVVLTLVKTWSAYFAGVSKMPRFKRRGDPVSIRAMSKSVFKVEGAHLELSMFEVEKARSVLRFEKHRELPSEPTRAVLSRRGDRWYVVLGVKLPAPPAVTNIHPPIGIDRGVVNALADSDGRTVSGFRNVARLEDRKHWIERRIAKKKVGSKNWRKWQVRLHRAVMRETDARTDRLHRESIYYARRNGTVVLEALGVQRMTRSARGTASAPGSKVRQKAGLNRAILSQGWGAFRFMLAYKLHAHGGRLVEVPAHYTSQTCKACGHVAAENRPTQAAFCCVACGYTAHADVNAAQVILARGLCAVSAAVDKAPRKSKKLYTVTGRAQKVAARTQSSETETSSDAGAGGALKLPVEDGSLSSPDEAGRSITTISLLQSNMPSQTQNRSRRTTLQHKEVLESASADLSEHTGLSPGPAGERLP